MVGVSPSTKLPQGTDNATQREVKSIRQSVETMAKSTSNDVSSILKGQLLKEIKVSGTASFHSHGLGKLFSGYIVVSKSDFVNVRDDRSSSYDKNHSIKLIADTTATISVWVF